MIKRMWIVDSGGVTREVQRCFMMGENGVVREISFDEALELSLARQIRDGRVYLAMAILIALVQAGVLLKFIFG